MSNNLTNNNQNNICKQCKSDIFTNLTVNIVKNDF